MDRRQSRDNLLQDLQTTSSMNNDDMKGRVIAWPYLRLSEMYLTIYAEALAQTGSSDEAVKQVNVVRARVGLQGLKESQPGRTSQQQGSVLLEAILNERACELGFEDTRFFDLIRYRRAICLKNNFMV